MESVPTSEHRAGKPAHHIPNKEHAKKTGKLERDSTTSQSPLFFILLRFKMFYFILFFLILKSLILTCVPKHEPPSHLPPHNISRRDLRK